MTTPSIDEILTPLDAYNASIPLEFSIGLQNFQSIRQYTKIPLAPITLIYGQNSAGKSAIHDALVFINDFLSPGGNSAEIYLDRWASRQRITRPLTKGFVGQSDDVVININAWGLTPYTFPSGDIAFLGTSKADILLSKLCGGEHEAARFSLRFHFSDAHESDGSSDWYIREFHLTVGHDEFIRYESHKISEFHYSYDTAFSINKKHPLFRVIGQLYGKPLDEIAKDCEFCNGETDIDDKDWLTLKELRMNMGSHDLYWVSDATPFSLNNYNKLKEEIQEAIAFRELVAEILESTSLSASRFIEIHSVPPLRPVPTKEESCFCVGFGNDKESDSPWKKLAHDIKEKDFYQLWSRLKPNSLRLKYISEQEGSLLPYVNHVLQHPLFLSTGYEIIGKCRFLISASLLAEIQDDNDEKDDNWIYFRQEILAYVNLMLRFVPDNFKVEIEDVGVGISQIIPVLCAIEEHSKVYIHQPELHLHPKQQSHLGDIFFERINNDFFDKNLIQWNSNKDKHFFIETHSEHVLLRILRRIRETNRSDIKNKLFGFTSDQLCVLYVDKDENGDSQVMQLRVAENGEFIDRWPHGFFTERDEDLFSE